MVAVRAQSSVEFIVILSIMFAIIMVMTSLNHDAILVHENRIRMSLAKDCVDEIHKASTLVYHQGDGSRMKVFLNIPSGVASSSVSEGIIEINMTISDGNASYFRKVDFPITGDIPLYKGYYWMDVISYGDHVELEY